MPRSVGMPTNPGGRTDIKGSEGPDMRVTAARAQTQTTTSRSAPGEIIKAADHDGSPKADININGCPGEDQKHTPSASTDLKIDTKRRPSEESKRDYLTA